MLFKKPVLCFSVPVSFLGIIKSSLVFLLCRDACPGTLWTSSNQRYFWIDLTAGPVTYGPSESGEGRVLSHSIPRVEHYNEAWRSKAMIPDISALIFSGTKVCMPSVLLNAHQT